MNKKIRFHVPQSLEERREFFDSVDAVEFLEWRARKEAEFVGRGKPVDAATYRCTVQALVVALGSRVVVDIGVWDGFLSRMLASIDGVELTVVDPWAAYKYYPQSLMDAVADSVIAWADTMPNVEIKRMRSLEAVDLFDDGSIDFLTTDGNHSYEQVVEEVASWLPKIKPGGWITGDNYESEKIAKAVKENIPEVKALAKGRVWWFKVPGEG